MAEEKKIHSKEEFEPLQAMGFFWMAFGILVLIGIFFTERGIGIITNVICGGLLLLIGVICYFRGKSNKKKRLSKLQ